MIECPSCAMESEKGQEKCPYCQYEFPVAKRSSRWAGIVFVLIMIWPLLKFVRFLFF